jgi:hypothetical protein
MTEATRITYDVSQAIAELKRLNKAIGEVGDKTVESLRDKATDALDTFEGGLNDISPVAGNVVGKIRGLVAAAGPMGAVMGTAAAGIAAVVSNLIDLPGLLADSEAGITAFGEAVDRQRKIFETFDDIGDKIAKGENERAIRSISLRQVEVAEEQVKLNGIKTSQQEELRSAIETIRAKEQALEKSIRKQKDLRRQLADGDQASQIERAAPKRERAVADLSAAAQREALKGNVDAAKELRDRAQELTEEFGGHVFFQKQVDQATKAISDGINKQVQAEQKIASQLQAELDIAKKIADEKKRGLDATLAEQRALQGERKLLQAGRKRLTEEQNVREDTDAADEAAGRVNAERVKLRAEFEFGARTLKENIRDSLKQSLSALGSKGLRDAGIESTESGVRQIEKIAQALLKPNLTANEAQAVQPDVAKLNAILGSLQSGIDSGTLSGGFQKDVDQFKRIVDEATRLGDAAGDFGQRRGGEAAIGRGSESPLVEPARNLGGAASKLDAAASKLLGIPSAPETATAATAAPAGAQAATRPVGQQNITVNANVKGGIIDAETTRAITEIIRKELRKNTSPKLN